MESEIFKRFPNQETFEEYWKENYVSVMYEDVKEIFEAFLDATDGHIFLSDYEEAGAISKEDFKEQLSQEAQFTFQDTLTEVFYEKNPELYEIAFEVFTESQMNGGEGKEIAYIFSETFHKLYTEFLDRLFDEKIVPMKKL